MYKIKQSSATRAVYNLLIVDESGSMASIAEQTKAGYTEVLQTIQQVQRKSPDVKQMLSLISFNTDGIHWIFDLMPIDQVMETQSFHYEPDGGTPLWDAIGTAVNRLQGQIRTAEMKKQAVFVSVLSDGYENSSEKYTAKMIKDLIEGLSAESWNFTYIGTDHDVTEVADSIGISKGNRACFERSELKQKGLKKVARAIEILHEKAMGNHFKDDAISLDNLMEVEVERSAGL